MESTPWAVTWIYPLFPLIGVVIGAYVVANLTKNRDHAAWLRNKQFETFVEFNRAADAYVNNISKVGSNHGKLRDELFVAHTAMLMVAPAPVRVPLQLFINHALDAEIDTPAESDEAGIEYLLGCARLLSEIYRLSQIYFLEAEPKRASKSRRKDALRQPSNLPG